MTKYMIAIITTLLITSGFANADIAAATKVLTAQANVVSVTS
jgi:hypothetical protein